MADEDPYSPNQDEDVEECAIDVPEGAAIMVGEIIFYPLYTLSAIDPPPPS
jgi:hypothetical protein